jgi:deoxyribose-phosphate aldolase
VAVCTVAGFPLGASATETKLAEAGTALRLGATEVDMVVNVGALKDGEYDRVRAEIAALAAICHGSGALLKVILETCLLTDEEKAAGCRLSVEAGADFVKTSTGFSTGGATAADVALMRATVGPDVGVKASGGIRTLDDLRAMVEAGASRIGASASVAIVQAIAGDHRHV